MHPASDDARDDDDSPVVHLAVDDSVDVGSAAGLHLEVTVEDAVEVEVPPARTTAPAAAMPWKVTRSVTTSCSVAIPLRCLLTGSCLVG